jgi:formylglycine-generating enzyme required for sulfatase activity
MRNLICFVSILLSAFSGINSTQAQQHPQALFQFSTQWQQAANETNFSFNLVTDSAIDEKDLIRLIEHWKVDVARTPTPIGTPFQTDEVSVALPGGLTMELMRIPSGSFLMGCYPGEQDSDDVEAPQHLVNIDYDFYMGKYEVTTEQWESVMGTTPWQNPMHPSSPATHISWHGAQTFVDALNQLGQGTFRLPSEAEWEYACRAGTSTRFYWGDDPSYILIDDFAWWSKNPEIYRKIPLPVGQLLPNNFGLYDMSGGVCEWCQDSYSFSDYWFDSLDYTDAPTDGSARESDQKDVLVLRGGSVYGYPDGHQDRSAYRCFLYGDGYNLTGFRVVRESEPVLPTVTPTATPTPFQPLVINLGQENEVELEMALIPSGSFMMGRSPGEQDSEENEDPRHEVTIDYDFYLGKYEVTKAQWQAVMGTRPWLSMYLYPNHDPESPANNITWDDAQEFLDKLNQSGQGAFRLPSEAEWEYACRAGTSTRFYWGDDPDYVLMDDYAWWTRDPLKDDKCYAHVVGQKLPNAFGLYDMSGNVWEWCLDDYMTTGGYNNAPSDGSAVISATSSYRKVRRGGRCLDRNPIEQRSANRSWMPSYTQDQESRQGFRVARDLLLPSTPEILLSQTAFNLGFWQTEVDFDIKNMGGGQLNWALSESEDWIECRTSQDSTAGDGQVSGSGNASITLAVTRTGLDAGSYSSDIILASNGGDAVIRVSLKAGGPSGGDEMTVNLPGGVTLEMVKIPAGSFMMGSDPSQQDSSDNEYPRHEVTIDYEFYMARCELTKRQWQAVMDTTPWSKENVLFYPDSPAVFISWHDVQDFISKMNMLGQGVFRLPSEAEWEYACRAGTATRFYWGDDLEQNLISDYAWCQENTFLSGKEYAHLTAQKLPNDFGLFDMSGNVEEWCQDYMHDDYTGAPLDGSPWESPSGFHRILRGGSWKFADKYRRSADRHALAPETRNDSVGVRLVMAVGGDVLPTPTPSPVPQREEISLSLPGNVTLEMIKIPAGSFMMGRYSNEQGSSDQEDPQHEVTINYDFFMGKYEITKAQWRAIMGTLPWHKVFYSNTDQNSPAQNITWENAEACVDAINALGLGTFRLPSEAEWEYACRAGTSTRYYWGDDSENDLIDYYARYSGNSYHNDIDSFALPVGRKRPNAFGLYDMSGNVWEWCRDIYHANYVGAPSDGSAWELTGDASRRILRGGGWTDGGDRCRSAYRSYDNTGSTMSYNGFRLVMEVPPAQVPAAVD